MSTELNPKALLPRSKVQNEMAADASKISEYINFRTEVIETNSAILLDGSSLQKFVEVYCVVNLIPALLQKQHYSIISIHNI